MGHPDGPVRSVSLEALSAFVANAPMREASLSAALEAKDEDALGATLRALSSDAWSAGAHKLVRACAEAIAFAQGLLADRRPGLVKTLHQQLQAVRSRAEEIVAATANNPALRQFAVTYGDDTAAGRLAECRALSLQARLDRPASFDWLFPCDRYAAQESDAPALSTDDVRMLLEIPLVGDAIWSHYTRLLDVSHLCVDHHGYVFPGGQAARGVSLCSPATVGACARVIRCLHLAGFAGQSRSGYPDPFGYSHAKGLQLRLEEDHARLNPGAEVPAVWAQAVLG